MDLTQKPIKSIIIARSDVMGDVILSTAIVNSLKQQYPNAKLYFLTQKVYHPLLAGIDGVSDCIEDPLPYHHKLSNIGPLLRLAKTLKTYHADLFIGLWNNPRYALISFLASIPYRVGHNYSLINRLFYNIHTTFNYLDFTKHQVEWNLACLDAIHVPINNPKTQLSRPDKADKRPYICMHLDASIRQKRIDPKRLLEWVDIIVKDSDRHQISQLTLVGQEQAVQVAAMINEQYAKDITIDDQTGKTSLTQLAAIVANADYYIGSDSGIGHMAAAYQTPSMIYYLNKNQSALEWGPWLNKHQLLITQHLCPDICRQTECVKDTCRTNLAKRVFKSQWQLLTTTDNEPIQTQSQRDYWYKTHLRIGVITQNMPSLDFKSYYLGPNPSIKKMRTEILRNNLNCIINLTNKDHLKYKFAIMLASNTVHAYPIYQAGTTIDACIKKIVASHKR